jgi:hypothetical protein
MNSDDLIDLGVASSETKGVPGAGIDEKLEVQKIGLADD